MQDVAAGPRARPAQAHLYSCTNCSRLTGCSGDSCASALSFCPSSSCAVAGEWPHLLAQYWKKLSSCACDSSPVAGGTSRGAASCVRRCTGLRALSAQCELLEDAQPLLTVRVGVELAEYEPRLVARAVDGRRVLQHRQCRPARYSGGRGS